MLNRVNGKQELAKLDMLIRALSDEMAEQRTHKLSTPSPNALQHEMEEAMYELRVRKLVFSALVGTVVGSGRAGRRNVRH